jgi:hypothetical protein
VCGRFNNPNKYLKTMHADRYIIAHIGPFKDCLLNIMNSEHTHRCKYRVVDISNNCNSFNVSALISWMENMHNGAKRGGEVSEKVASLILIQSAAQNYPKRSQWTQTHQISSGWYLHKKFLVPNLDP